MEQENKFNTAEQGLFAIDPLVLILDVLKRWMWIVLAALMVTVGTKIAADVIYRPVYQSTMTFVVTSRGSTTVYNNLSAATNVAMVFEDLLNSTMLQSAILEEIGQESFHGTIEAMAVPESNLLTVTVSASDPVTAFKVARAVTKHHEQMTYRVVSDVVMEVLQKPEVPMTPSNVALSDHQLKKIMLIAAVGAAVVIGFLYYIRDTVRSSKEAKAKLDCTYLGEIPHERKYKTLKARLYHQRHHVLITNPIVDFAFTEAIRKLHRRLERHLGSRKVMMVTSVLENEGKSTVAVNLALSMANKHEKVLLIDCDLRKPACYKLLGVDAVKIGTRDVLCGAADFSDALLRDKKSGMYIMLEKKGNRDSGELVANDRMKKLINWARSEFDYVILDMPPMAVVSDAEYVSGIVDASLLVVRQNVALAPALNHAIAELDGGKAKLLGCVLNNVYSSSLSSGHGCGHGYGYGGYGKYGKYGHYGADEDDE